MLQKSSIERVAEVFFISPMTSHYLREISKKAGIAHTSVKRDLLKLVRLGLIEEKIERRGGRRFPVYVARRDAKEFRRGKRGKMVYNLSSVLESGLIEHLEEKLTPKTIVLFGSYRRGEDIEGSDIDFFVECKEEPVNLTKFENKLGRKIELHFNEDFINYSKELKNNIINGIVLSGFLEGYK
ncbi:nucleotidyltransferase domain-containing protein [Candidatus Woesearchaeota archaeon]|nr:nucleotidyltransferase domain-containing protein [Candidatus Woesearchaeota archaeon]